MEVSLSEEQITEVTEVTVDEETTKSSTLIRIINSILPPIAKLEVNAKDKSIVLYLLIKSDVVDQDGKKTQTWQPIHVLYSGDNQELYLSGYLGGLETVSNLDRLYKLEAENDSL
jgi:hypothetical protein